MRKLLTLVICFSLTILFSADFNQRIPLGQLSNVNLNEASGLAAGSRNPGYIWVHNDSGANEIYAMDLTGVHVATYTLSGITFTDVEDIVVGVGPIEGEQYLYVADIGDNLKVRDAKEIYRFVEPTISSGSHVINDIDVIEFQYPASVKHDSETLMLDPLTKDLFIVTKSAYDLTENEVDDILFKLVYPQSHSSTNIASEELTFDYDKVFVPLVSTYMGATGGDISSFGYEVLIRTYNKVYYWERFGSESLSVTLSRPFTETNYDPEAVPPEVQGEAICWNPAATGFYTTSEEPAAAQAQGYEAFLSFTSRTDSPTLPVELSSFTAIQTENDFVEINWLTQSETNVLGFEIFKNTSNELFNATKINNSYILGSNTSQPNYYTFIDKEVEFGVVYNYWLKCVDLDGTYAYFGPIEIRIKEENSVSSPNIEISKLNSIYPNPFNPVTNISFSISEFDEGTLKIFNSRGQIVKNYGSFTTGEYQLNWNSRTHDNKVLGSGIYYVRLKSNRVSVTKKILLLK